MAGAAAQAFVGTFLGMSVSMQHKVLPGEHQAHETAAAIKRHASLERQARLHWAVAQRSDHLRVLGLASPERQAAQPCAVLTTRDYIEH
jgi:hypothetical protein